MKIDRSSWVLWAWVGCTVVWVSYFVVGVWAIRINRIDPGAGWENLRLLYPYWWVGGVLWVALSAIAWKLSQGSSMSRGWGVGPVAVILGVALLARVAVVLGSSPQLSDDLWRYIHDGRQLARGISPYGQTPQELGAGQGQDPILDQINHPQLVTIYQPTSQYVFGLLWWLHPEGVDPLGDRTFRVGFALLDVLIVVLLMWQLRLEGRSVWWSVLYAWHPLVISEVAGSGHQDVIGIVLLIATLMLAGVGAGVGVVSFKRAALAGAAFAGAVAVKPIILPLALPLAWGWRASPRGLVVALLGGVAVLAGLYLPFLWLGGGMHRLWETVGTFVGGWSFNSSVHAGLVYITGSKPAADILAAGLLLVVLLGCMARGYDLWRTSVVFLLAGLLCSSTVYPWYLLWALALVPIRFHGATWVFSLTIMWSYAVLGHITQWTPPRWVSAAEYLPVYGALIYASLFLRGRYEKVQNSLPHGQDSTTSGQAAGGIPTQL